MTPRSIYQIKTSVCILSSTRNTFVPTLYDAAWNIFSKLFSSRAYIDLFTEYPGIAQKDIRGLHKIPPTTSEIHAQRPWLPTLICSKRIQESPRTKVYPGTINRVRLVERVGKYSTLLRRLRDGTHYDHEVRTVFSQVFEWPEINVLHLKRRLLSYLRHTNEVYPLLLHVLVQFRSFRKRYCVRTNRDVTRRLWMFRA